MLTIFLFYSIKMQLHSNVKYHDHNLLIVQISWTELGIVHIHTAPNRRDRISKLTGFRPIEKD